eukprot:scpid52718/ scgid19911/ 
MDQPPKYEEANAAPYPPGQPTNPAYPPAQPASSAPYPAHPAAPAQAAAYPPAPQQGVPAAPYPVQEQPAPYPTQPPPVAAAGAAYSTGPPPAETKQPVDAAPPVAGVVVQQPAPATTTVVITQTNVLLGPESTTVNCPNCGKTGPTVTSCVPSVKAWLFCFVLWIVGCGLCCWIPCVIPSMQDVTHHCYNCQHVVGQYRSR